MSSFPAKWVACYALWCQAETSVAWAPTADAAAFEMCRNGSGIRSLPGRGTALLFASSSTADASQPLARMWHRGCHVDQGVKLMMTKFVAPRETQRDRILAHAELWEGRGNSATEGR